MVTKRRFAAAILAAFILVAVTASLFIVVHEADHDCIGEGCPICAVITLCQNTLKALGDALIAAALVFACFCFAASVMSFSRIATYNQTPISLKVKLLN